MEEGGKKIGKNLPTTTARFVAYRLCSTKTTRERGEKRRRDGTNTGEGTVHVGLLYYAKVIGTGAGGKKEGGGFKARWRVGFRPSTSTTTSRYEKGGNVPPVVRLFMGGSMRESR